MVRTKEEDGWKNKAGCRKGHSGHPIPWNSDLGAAIRGGCHNGKRGALC